MYGDGLISGGLEQFSRVFLLPLLLFEALPIASTPQQVAEPSGFGAELKKAAMKLFMSGKAATADPVPLRGSKPQALPAAAKAVVNVHVYGPPYLERLVAIKVFKRRPGDRQLEHTTLGDLIEQIFPPDLAAWIFCKMVQSPGDHPDAECRVMIEGMHVSPDCPVLWWVLVALDWSAIIHLSITLPARLVAPS